MGFIGNSKNSKDAPLLRDLIKDTLSLIGEGKEDKKVPGPGGFELGTSRLRGRNQLDTPTARSQQTC